MRKFVRRAIVSLVAGIAALVIGTSPAWADQVYHLYDGTEYKSQGSCESRGAVLYRTGQFDGFYCDYTYDGIFINQWGWHLYICRDDECGSSWLTGSTGDAKEPLVAGTH